MLRQKTIKKEVTLLGAGLHTGDKVRLTLKPAPANSGIIFLRSDLTGKPTIPAKIKNTTESLSNTTLSKGKVRVQTVEHLLSALFGLGIDNVLIELDAQEVPAGDGSSLPFVKLCQRAGITPQSFPKKRLKVTRPIIVSQEDKYLIALPSSEFKITYLLVHPHSLIATQLISLSVRARSFIKEISPARTFATEGEALNLRNKGLAKGGTLNNAIVVGRKISSPLRFPDEFARHKVLDLIGDLSLIGCSLSTYILAIKSGHGLNIALGKEIKRALN